VKTSATVVEQAVTVPCATCGFGEQVRRHAPALGAAGGVALCRGCGTELAYEEALRRAVAREEVAAMICCATGPAASTPVAS